MFQLVSYMVLKYTYILKMTVAVIHPVPVCLKMMIIDGNCIIASPECVEKRLLWYSSQGRIITHPHLSHWSQAIVMGWWIVECWMLWPSLSNSWYTYKIHATAPHPEYKVDISSKQFGWTLIVVTWWITESLGVVTKMWHWALSRYQDKWRSSRTLAAADLRLWSSNNVWQCVAGCWCWWLVWIMNGNISPGSTPSSPVTGRARPVPPCYLVTIIRYNFTTP